MKPRRIGTIKNQVWVRFYVHFSPGAPGGHGNMIAAYDQNDAWYEIGWQFDAMMGVWHGGGGENPLRSMPLIRDQWYCVEAYCDGAKRRPMPQWWIDGVEAGYYMAANETLIPKAVTSFKRVEVGFPPYAGLPLGLHRLPPPDGKKGSSTTTRAC